MCIICGDMSHEGLELLFKGMSTPPKKVRKEKPRYKTLALIEKEFKIEYANLIGDMSLEILKEAEKFENEIH